MQRQASRHGLWSTLALIVLIIVLFAIFVDLRAVAEQVLRADWRLLVAASGTLVIGLGAYAVRWRLLLANKPGWLPTFHAGNTGHMLNLFIPFRAGEPARIIMLAREKSVSLAEVTSSFIVERLFEQIMRLSALGGAIVFGAGLPISASSAGGAVAFLAIAFGGLFWLVNNRAVVVERWPARFARLPRITEDRARTQLAGLLEGLGSVASARRLALTLLWSVLAWVCFWGFYVLALQALRLDLQSRDLLAISLGALALAPPSAPSQPGVYNASIVVPLSLVGFDETLLTSYTILLHALQIIWMTGLALWGLAQSGASARELLARPVME